MLLLIVKDPVVTPSLKSDVFTVPETVEVDQYKVVPLGTFVVDTVKVTDEPSFNEVVDGDTEYVGSLCFFRKTLNPTAPDASLDIIADINHLNPPLTTPRTSYFVVVLAEPIVLIPVKL